MKRKTLAGIVLLAIMASAVWAAQREIRIRFAKGRTTAIVKGSVKNYERQDYLLGARAGQTLNANVASRCKSMYLEVYGPDTANLTLDTRESKSVSLELPDDGDYKVRVQEQDGKVCPYTLEVNIR